MNFLNHPIIIATVPVFVVGLFNLSSILLTWYLNKKSIKASESNIVNKIDSLNIDNSKTEQNSTGDVSFTNSGNIGTVNFQPFIQSKLPDPIIREITKNKAK